MLKLKLRFGKIAEKIKTGFIENFDILYDDLTRQSSSQNKTSQKQQLANEQKLITKQSSFRISSKKQYQTKIDKNIPNIKKLGKQKPKQLQTLIKLEQQEHLLLSRKKKLLTELNEINCEIKTRQQNQSRIRQVTNSQTTNGKQMTQKAMELVKKMNKQRQDFSQRRRKSIEELNQSIIKSIQQFHLSLAEEEKMKEIRRQQIQNRINERKKKAIQRGISVEMTHQLIQQFIDNTLKLQYHSQLNPQVYSNQHMYKSHGPQQTDKKLNPEHFESSIPHLPHIKTENSKASLKSSTKSYSKSPFLEKILKQDERKKKQQYLKALEKKRVYLKHKQYAEKIRGKVRQYGSDSMFLT